MRNPSDTKAVTCWGNRPSNTSCVVETPYLDIQPAISWQEQIKLPYFELPEKWIDGINFALKTGLLSIRIDPWFVIRLRICNGLAGPSEHIYPNKHTHTGVSDLMQGDFNYALPGTLRCIGCA